MLDWTGLYGSKLIGYNHPRMYEPDYLRRLSVAANTKITNPGFPDPGMLGLLPAAAPAGAEKHAGQGRRSLCRQFRRRGGREHDEIFHQSPPPQAAGQGARALKSALCLFRSGLPRAYRLCAQRHDPFQRPHRHQGFSRHHRRQSADAVPGHRFPKVRSGKRGAGDAGSRGAGIADGIQSRRDRRGHSRTDAGGGRTAAGAAALLSRAVAAVPEIRHCLGA